MSEIYTHRHAIEQWKHYPVDSSGYVVDESQFSNKSIIRNILEVRAVETKAAIDRGDDVSDFMVQVLPCVEVEELDRNECPCAPASGCYWLRTKAEIPRYIKMISVTGIVANKENPRFTYIKWDKFQYIPIARNKSMRHGRYWTIRDSGGDGPYILLYGDRDLEVIAISAIWEDPMCAEAYPKCGTVDLEAKCNPLDIDFYTDAWLRDIIISRTWQKLLPVRQTAPFDGQNDDTHSNNPLNTQL